MTSHCVLPFVGMLSHCKYKSNQREFFKDLNLYGSYHCDGGGGAVKLPVERQPRQLALQLHADVAVFLSRQRNLGLAVDPPVTSCQTGLNHLTQVGEEGFDGSSQTSVELLRGGEQDLFTIRNHELILHAVFSSVYLRSLLDGCCVHPLLPHTVHVCQQDMVRRLPKPALGEELAAADAHGEPGPLQEDLSRRPAGLHHGSEPTSFHHSLNRKENLYDVQINT